MAKDPAVLFYTSDFLSGTMLMRNDQVGKYIKLLCIQHQQGHLSEEDMLEICGAYDERIFSKFVKDENGLYYNVRMEVEANKRRAYIESRSNNRKGNKNEDMNEHMKKDMNEDMPNHMTKHMENENINENINNNKNKYNDAIISIFEYWKTISNKSRIKLTDKLSKVIEKTLKDYTEEEIKCCIDRYWEVLRCDSYFFDYEWDLETFLTRQKGIAHFTEDGEKWVNYQKEVNKKGANNEEFNGNNRANPTELVGEYW